MKAHIYISLLLFSSPIFAKYRVYQYLIKDGDLAPNTITSTLSATSYISYYGSKISFQIDLLRTWMCPGDTSKFKAICPSPYRNAEAIQELIK